MDSDVGSVLLKDIVKDVIKEEQVELIDYLRILWRRRWIILIGTLLIVLFTGAISFLIPPMYEATAQLQIGRVWEKDLENPYLMVERINSDAFLARVIERVNIPTTPFKMKKGKMVEAYVLEGGTSGQKIPLLISIKVHYNDPQKAVDITNAVASILTEGHSVRFEEKLSEYRAYEKDLTREVARIEEQINKLERMVGKQQVSPSVNAPAVILLQAQLEQKNAQLLNFKKELKDTRINNTSSIITENSKLIAPPILPKDRIDPRVGLYLALATVLGIFLTVLLSFFWEYLQQVRNRKGKLYLPQV